MKLVPRAAARRALGDSLYSLPVEHKLSHSTLALQSLLKQPPYNQPWHPRRRTKHSLASSATRRHPYSTKADKSQPLNTPEPSKPASISEHVRLLMRRVPYPVAIITATDPSSTADTSFRGMTVSSFNTVTLSPTPIISFNVRRPSETLNALLASGRFLVHLLVPSPETATLARDFSKGNITLASMLSGHGTFEFGKLEGDAEQPLPMLRRREAGLPGVHFPFVFECALLPQKIDVYDHSIVLGEVVRVLEGAEVEGEAGRLCLTYADTKFWKMGEQV